MADLDLDAIRARAEAATPGPWWLTGHTIRSGPQPPVDFESDWPLDASGQDEWMRLYDEWWDATDDVLAHEFEEDADAEFVAHARSDVPALLAEVDRLRVRLDAALAAVDLAEALSRAARP